MELVRRFRLGALLLAFTSVVTVGASARADQGGPCGDDGPDGPDQRQAACRRVEWCAQGTKGKRCRCREDVEVKLLGINDFHGQLSAGRLVAGRPVGGAAVLASYLHAAGLGEDDNVILCHAGDHVGASPAASALLQDEPSITFLNMLSNDSGHRCRSSSWVNVIGTLGNHEFDEGRAELLRLLDGGNHPAGPFLEKKWRGADFPYVCSNVFDKATGRSLIDPCLVRHIGPGLKMGFIGAVLKGTPSIVTASGVAGLEFRDEADSINACVRDLKCRGIRAIIVQIHQGGFQTSFTGPTPVAGTVTGDILDIISRLDDEVDVVVSGHTHAFTNAMLSNAHGHPVLVTQSFSASTAYADIRLVVDGSTGDVVEKSASIQTTWADEGPGLTPDLSVKALVTAAEERVAPLVNQVIGTAAVALNRTESPAGESSLGNLIADAQRAAMATQLCFMNPGGIRQDLDAGPATWGELFTIQPFGNVCVKMDMTGAQVKTLLEQQWAPTMPPAGRILKTSGFVYTWSASAPVGSRVTSILVGGVAINPAATYSITCNNFLAGGGDGFTTFNLGTNRVVGPIDLDALIDYIESLPQPFSAAIEGRIVRVP